MTSKQLPPGLARREHLLSKGRNISRRDFTDEEWAELEAKTAEIDEYRRTHAPTPFPEVAAS